MQLLLLTFFNVTTILETIVSINSSLIPYISFCDKLLKPFLAQLWKYSPGFLRLENKNGYWKHLLEHWIAIPKDKEGSYIGTVDKILSIEDDNHTVVLENKTHDATDEHDNHCHMWIRKQTGDGYFTLEAQNNTGKILTANGTEHLLIASKIFEKKITCTM